jgi:hypothetical protein
MLPPAGAHFFDRWVPAAHLTESIKSVQFSGSFQYRLVIGPPRDFSREGLISGM